MIKNKACLILGSVLLLQATIASATESQFTQQVQAVSDFTPQKDKEYSVLQQPIEQAPTVIEFFSFNCHSCYNYQFVYQIPQKIQANLKSGENYQYMSIDDMLNAGVLAQAWSVTEVLGNKDALMNEMYYGLQTAQNIKGADDVKALIMRLYHLDESQFYAAWDNPKVIAHNANQFKLAKQANITRTPTFVINGKYAINVGNIEAKTHEEYIDKFLKVLDYVKNLK